MNYSEFPLLFLWEIGSDYLFAWTGSSKSISRTVPSNGLNQNAGAEKETDFGQHGASDKASENWCVQSAARSIARGKLRSALLFRYCLPIDSKRRALFSIDRGSYTHVASKGLGEMALRAETQGIGNV